MTDLPSSTELMCETEKILGEIDKLDKFHEFLCMTEGIVEYSDLQNFWQKCLDDARLARQILGFTDEEHQSWVSHIDLLRGKAKEALVSSAKFTDQLWECMLEDGEDVLNPERYWRSIWYENTASPPSLSSTVERLSTEDAGREGWEEEVIQLLKHLEEHSLELSSSATTRYKLRELLHRVELDPRMYSFIYDMLRKMDMCATTAN